MSAKAFRKFTLGFRQGTLEEGITEEQWIGDALNFLEASEQQAVKTFLTELLARDPSGPELQKVWNESSASYLVADDDELRSFLRLIVALIEAKDKTAPQAQDQRS